MRKKHDIINPMSLSDPPIERKARTGPTATPITFGSSQVKNDDTGNVSEEEKQFAVALKKNTKEVTVTIEGKINIISQAACAKEPLCVKYNEDFEYIGVGCNDGSIRLYKSSGGKQVSQLVDDEVDNKRSPVTSIKHRSIYKTYPMANCLTGTYANGLVKCWNYNMHQCIYTIKEKRQTFGITYHPRVPKFVTYGDDSRVCFYDEETKTMERVLSPSDNPTVHDGHMSRIFAACFHPRNNYEFLTGGWDDLVHYWDLRQPHAIRHLSGIHMCGEGLDINAKGTEILTCAFQPSETLQVFDYGSGKRLSCIEPDIHSSRLYCGRFASKDFIVCGGTDSNLFRLIDLQTITTTANMNNLPGGIYGMDLGAVKKKIEKTKEHAGRPKSDISLVPRVVFISARKIYQIEFY